MKKNHFPGFGSVVVILLFLLSAVLSLLLVGKVAINYDISDYLDEKTETKSPSASLSPNSA